MRPSRSNSAARSSGPLSRIARLWHRPDFQKVRRAFAAETIRTSARTAAVRVQHRRRSYFSVQSRCHVGGDTTRIPTRTFWFWFCINGIFLRQTEQIVRFARCNSPHVRTILAPHVTLQLVDRRRLRSSHDCAHTV